MSTKIYDAYKLNSSISLERLFIWLHKIRKDHFEYVIHEMKSHVSWENDYSKMRAKYVEVSKRMEEVIESGYYDKLNFLSSICVIPYKKEIYVKFYLGKYMEELEKTAFFKKNLKDFHYQNSTDRPKEITSQDWSNRRKVWDAIGELGDTVGEMGFVFDIFQEKRSCHRAFWRIDKELMVQFNIPDPFAPKETDVEKAK